MAEVTPTNPKGAGRPQITQDQKDEMVSKLEPFLKSGLSISKSILEAGIAKATFYRVMSEDEEFRDKINRFKQFVSVLLNSSIVSHLQDIIAKQAKKEALSKEDISFMQWFAEISAGTKEEFSKRAVIETIDPEVELQRFRELILQSGSKEIKHDDPPEDE